MIYDGMVICMSKVKVGDIVECVVTGVQSYGAFVLIDNRINGLIHISEISKGYVRNIEDFVRVGETIFVKILENFIWIGFFS